MRKIKDFILAVISWVCVASDEDKKAKYEAGQTKIINDII